MSETRQNKLSNLTTNINKIQNNIYKKSYFLDLNKSQKKAVEHLEGPLFEGDNDGGPTGSGEDYKIYDINDTTKNTVIEGALYVGRVEGLAPNAQNYGQTFTILNYERQQKDITVVITANRPNGAAINTGDVTNDLSINLTFTVGNFETSHNFDQTHINVTNGEIDPTSFNDNNDNTFSAVLNSTTDGQCIITVNANSFQDKIFNNNIFPIEV